MKTKPNISASVNSEPRLFAEQPSAAAGTGKQPSHEENGPGRAEIRKGEHRLMGSRQSQRPVERSDQSRKHGRHAGPKKA
jgi:hypothetical protein